MPEFFEWCSINPKEFQEDNKDVRAGISIGRIDGDLNIKGGVSADVEDKSVSAGRDIKDSAVATGDENVQDVRVREGGEVDIVKELVAFREAIEGLDLEAALKRHVLRDVASAEDEVGSEGEDKGYIADMLAGALKRIERAGTAVSSVTALRDAGFAIGGWLSVHADKIVPVLQRLWPG